MAKRVSSTIGRERDLCLTSQTSAECLTGRDFEISILDQKPGVTGQTVEGHLPWKAMVKYGTLATGNAEDHCHPCRRLGLQCVKEEEPEDQGISLESVERPQLGVRPVPMMGLDLLKSGFRVIVKQLRLSWITNGAPA